MARFNFLVITLLISISTFFFTESEVSITIKNTFPQPTIQSSTAANNQGLLVNSYLDLIVDVVQEDTHTFFEQLGLINSIFKEQQENYLVYHKTNRFINLSLTTKQIIYPFHSFT